MAKPTSPEAIAERNTRQMKYLNLGIGTFITGFCTVRLVMHYFFGYTISGHSIKFGYYDENYYWVFFVVGFIWLTFSIISFQRYRKNLKKS